MYGGLELNGPEKRKEIIYEPIKGLNAAVV